MFILYASLVVPQSFHRYPLFSFVKAFGGDRAVRKEDNHHYTPHTTEGANNKELELPGRQACFDVADTGRRQLISISQTWNCLPVAEQATQSNTESICGVP